MVLVVSFLDSDVITLVDPPFEILSTFPWCYFLMPQLQAAEQAVSKDLPECIEAKNRLLALAKVKELVW